MIKHGEEGGLPIHQRFISRLRSERSHLFLHLALCSQIYKICERPANGARSSFARRSLSLFRWSVSLVGKCIQICVSYFAQTRSTARLKRNDESGRVGSRTKQPFDTDYAIPFEFQSSKLAPSFSPSCSSPLVLLLLTITPSPRNFRT